MNQEFLPSTVRFSNRVSDYVRWRPHYPAEAAAVLKRKGLLPEGGTVADIGSGTGISAQLFLAAGCRVLAVEPNAEMRTAAEEWLGREEGFVSVNGTAEATGLESGAADMVFCGQAFHWFDRAAAKREFARILKPGGAAVLCWNNRDMDDPFQQEYERVLREMLPEYSAVSHKHPDDAEIAEWYAPEGLHIERIPHSQSFDLEGLKGRLLSSSYCPKSGPLHNEVMARMEELFARYAREGVLGFRYTTCVYWGVL